MEIDSIEQYGQAAGQLPLDDWHPISMALLWRVLLVVHDGPQPMLVLQLLCYWGAFLYLAYRLLNETSRLPLALAAIAVAYLPFLLNFSGVIWKDTHLALSLFWATLILTLGAPSRTNAVVVAMLTFYGMSVRHNGIAAGVPIIVLWSCRYAHLLYLSGRYRVPLATIAFCGVYLLSGIVASHVVSYEHTCPWCAQLLNELTFIKCRTQSDWGVMRDYLGTKALVLNAQEGKTRICNEVSRLAATADTNDIYDEQLLQWSDTKKSLLFRQWMQSVLGDFSGYLKYRLTVYLTFLRPLSYSKAYYTFLTGVGLSPWPFKLPAGTLNFLGLSAALNNYIASASAHCTLLFRPFFWLITLSFSVGILAYQKRWLPWLVAGSGWLYLLGYFFALPSPDFRYAYYAIFAQVLVVFIVSKDVSRHVHGPGGSVSIAAGRSA
jgi:hypothetical protein